LEHPLRAFGSNEDRRAAGLVPAGINPAARSFLPNAPIADVTVFNDRAKDALNGAGGDDW
jgi:hypothetical protein